MRKKQAVTLVSQKYMRKGLLAESWHRMRKNPGVIFSIIVLSMVILILIYSLIFISFEDITRMNPADRFQPPSAAHPFGTDQLGRDLFVRTLYGSRYSLPIAAGSITLACVVGVFFGALAGFFGGMAEEAVMRVSDMVASIPAILLGMVIVSIFGSSFTNLMFAIGFTATPQFVRMTRASVLTVKGNEYVEATQAIGMSRFRIIFTQVLPNSLSPLIVVLTSRIGSAILQVAGLSFLGFGVPVPLPEWGALVSAGRNYIMMAPHITLFPGLFIMLTTFSCALLGDGLRDALDPKLKI